MDKILIADDEKVSRLALAWILQKEGFHALEVSNGKEAVDLFTKEKPSAVILDLMMPVMGGMDTLKALKDIEPSVPVIILTGHGDISAAVQAIKFGAYDFIEKSAEPKRLILTLSQALNYYTLSEENRKLKDRLHEIYSFQSIVTRNPLMKKALLLAEKAADSPDTTVSIYGESGSGKEVLARAIHFSGKRCGNRFVAVNCAAIPPTLLESEIFGHVKGAFTGADREREGKFGLARGGTILLDEIGDMPLELQPKLLRMLEEHTYDMLGSNRQYKADFRVIVATHRDLQKMVKEGLFREDLFHRINIFPVHIPPLRERKEDIPLLADYFIDLLRKGLGKHLAGISQKGMDLLIQYNWPGNIRELRNCLERATLLVKDELIRPEHLIINSSVSAKGRSLTGDDNKININLSMNPEEMSLDRIIDRVLQTALERCDNNKSLAADLLKVNRKMFYRRK